MQNLQVFKNIEFGQIRVMEKDGEPWFIGKEVAEVLDYRTANDMTRNLDADEKDTQIVRTPGGEQEMIIINESGLYSAILRSRKPEAKKFKKWVTSEVLPAIRKTGGYIPINENDTDMEILAKAVLISQKTIEKKDELIKKQAKELEVKNKFISQIAESENSFKVEEVAAIASKNGIKIGRNKLWEKLRGWGLIKEATKYDPKQRYIDCGWFEVVERAKETSRGVLVFKTTHVTGKGQVYIINRLIKEKEVA